jgi:hypothetical protein
MWQQILSTCSTLESNAILFSLKWWRQATVIITLIDDLGFNEGPSQREVENGYVAPKLFAEEANRQKAEGLWVVWCVTCTYIAAYLGSLSSVIISIFFFHFPKQHNQRLSFYSFLLLLGRGQSGTTIASMLCSPYHSLPPPPPRQDASVRIISPYLTQFIYSMVYCDYRSFFVFKLSTRRNLTDTRSPCFLSMKIVYKVKSLRQFRTRTINWP